MSVLILLNVNEKNCISTLSTSIAKKVDPKRQQIENFVNNIGRKKTEYMYAIAE